MTAPAEGSAVDRGFDRHLGLFSLTCLGLNSVIGSGIFLTPGGIAQRLGSSSLLGFALGALLCYAIALCFAEMAGMFPSTGGAYRYARETFGHLTGFLVGWVIWLSAVLGWAAVAVGFSDALGGMVGVGAGHLVSSLGIIAALSALNLLGTRVGAGSNNLLACAKMLPLLMFVACTFPRLHGGSLGAPASDWRGGFLMVLYTFSGFEEIPVPAGETRNPQRTIPSALALVLIISAAFYMVIQAVVCSSGLAGSETPLQDASRTIPWLLGMVGVGSILSIASVNASIAFTGPRSLWALAQDGGLSRTLAALHPVFHTPGRAIAITGVVAAILTAGGGTFEKLAILSALASVLQYLPTVLAVIVWRLRDPQRLRPVRVRGGIVWAAVALLVCGLLLASSTREELGGSAVALLLGAILYRFRPAGVGEAAGP